MPIVLSLLQPVIAAVTHAGRMLIEESRRTDGPRGADDKAAIDVEIDEYLADALTAIIPSAFGTWLRSSIGQPPSDSLELCGTAVYSQRTT